MGFLSRCPGRRRVGSFIPEGNQGRKEALRTGQGNPSLTHSFCLVLAVSEVGLERERRGTGEAGRKLSKDVGSSETGFSARVCGECTFAPPEARGPALCPCVSLTVGSAPQSGGVAWPWRRAAEGSSPAMGSSVLCWDSQQLGNCRPAGHRTPGWDTPTVSTPAVYPSFLSLKQSPDAGTL